MPIALALVPTVPPPRRRHIVEVRVEGELSFTDENGLEIVLRLLEKSGKRARFLIELPDEIRITPNSF